MKISYKSFCILLCLLVIILFFGYREFLYLYKSMLTEFIGYYKYQNIIIYYETGNKEFMDKFPMNVRFLGLFLQYIVFKIVPCLTFPNIEIKNNVHELYECATFSLSLVNYVSKYVNWDKTISSSGTFFYFGVTFDIFGCLYFFVIFWS